MAISAKEKELSAVGVSVATGCKPCTDYHVKAVRKAGAADDEIEQAVADALAVRRVATAIMERHAEGMAAVTLYKTPPTLKHGTPL